MLCRRSLKRITSIGTVLLCCFSMATGQTVPISQVVQCEYFSAISGGYYPVPPPAHEPRVSVQFLGTGDWLRYDSVNFAAGTFDSVTFRSAGWSGQNGTAGHKARLRLDSPTGTELVTFDLLSGGWTPIVTKALSTKLTGVRTLYLTFEGGDTVCWIADWLRFGGTATVNASEARTYYVAPYGNDAGDGLSVTTAFRTIQRAASVMKPGSICNIRQGVYRETVRPTYTGLSTGAPLTFQAYGNEQVFISGADSVKGWTRHSGNIYKTTMPWSLGRYKNQLLINGQTAVVARSPNIDDPWQPDPGWVDLGPTGLVNWNKWHGEIHPFLTPSRVFLWNSTTDVANPTTGIWPLSTTFKMTINQYGPSYLFNKPTDYFKGGLLSNQCNWWVILSEIKGSTCAGNPPTTTFSYNKAINNLGIQGENGTGAGYVSYVLALLDQPNEWFRDSAGTVYLWAPDGGDPTNHLVEAKRRLTGFDLTNKSYVTLKGLRFIATSATLENAWHCTIDDCHWKYPSYYDAYEWYEEFCGENWFGSPYDPSDGFSGVFIGGGYNTVKRSSSQVSAGSGFILSGRGHHLVTNNIVHDCNWLPTYNAGIRQHKRDASIIEDCGGNLIEYNTVFNCGRANIELNYGYGSGNPPTEEITRIMHNDLGRCAWLAPECMSIGAHGIGNIEVAYNRFHSVVGGTAGYVGADPSFGGKAFKVHHNVFYTGKPIGSTGQMRLPHIIWCFDVNDTVMRVFNNTIVDSSRSSRLWEDQWIKQYYPPKVFVNNLFGWNDHAKWKYTDTTRNDYSLQSGSPAIDAGVEVPGWVEAGAYVGRAPDLGAYEFGQPVWRAGADWQEKPWTYPPTPISATSFRGGLVQRGVGSARLVACPRFLVVTAPAKGSCRLMLYDMQGALVLSRTMPRGGTSVIPTATISSGMYVLRASGQLIPDAQWKVCVRR